MDERVVGGHASEDTDRVTVQVTRVPFAAVCAATAPMSAEGSAANTHTTYNDDHRQD